MNCRAEGNRRETIRHLCRMLEPAGPKAERKRQNEAPRNRVPATAKNAGTRGGSPATWRATENLGCGLRKSPVDRSQLRSLLQVRRFAATTLELFVDKPPSVAQGGKAGGARCCALAFTLAQREHLPMDAIFQPGQLVRVNLAGLDAGGVTFQAAVTDAVGHILKQT